MIFKFFYMNNFHCLQPKFLEKENKTGSIWKTDYEQDGDHGFAALGLSSILKRVSHLAINLQTIQLGSPDKPFRWDLTWLNSALFQHSAKSV